MMSQICPGFTKLCKKKKEKKEKKKGFHSFGPIMHAGKADNYIGLLSLIYIIITKH